LRALNRFDEALASYDRALALRPDHSEVLNNRGILLYDLRRLNDALAMYARALALRPDHAEAHWNEALARLRTGDYIGGWAKSGGRWQRGPMMRERRDFAQPLWLGREPIEGKTILLHAEQGLGDTIQFCRYAPLVAARGARVVLEVQPALR